MTKTFDFFADAPGIFLTDAIPDYAVDKTEDPLLLPVITSKTFLNCDLPKKIADLNSGTELNIYKFDKSMSANATAMGFTAQITRKQMLFAQDFVRYQWVDCNGTKKKFGIGLRCFIHVTNYKGRVGYSTLPGIAANVELGNAKCTFSLASLGFGIDGSFMAEGFQKQGDYTVENFANLSLLFNNVLKSLNAKSDMKIEVVEMP